MKMSFIRLVTPSFDDSVCAILHVFVSLSLARAHEARNQTTSIRRARCVEACLADSVRAALGGLIAPTLCQLLRAASALELRRV